MLALVICLICLPPLLLLIEHLAEKRDRRRFPPPGRLVQIHSSHLHVFSVGVTGPTVILEAGLAATSLSWVLTQPLIAGFAQVIAYDRAGLGWSEPSESPPTLPDILSDLDTLIATLQLATPLILVGHSFGGLVVQAFAHLHPTKVAGLLLLDPVSLHTYSDPNSQYRNRLGIAIRLSRRGALLARLAVVRGALFLALNGGRKLPSLIGKVSAGPGGSVITRLAAEIAKLPSETHAPIAAYWSRPASFNLMANYLRLVPVASEEAQAMPIPLNIPVIVLSAASAKPAELIEREASIAGHPSSRHTQIPNTTHWLQLDRPDLVVAAVHELTLLIK